MNKPFSGKVALITGGSAGIGQAAALAFAAQGAHVIIGDVNVEAGATTAALVEQQHAVSCIFRRTDVTVESDVSALVNTAVDTFGRLDFALNSAGVVGPTSLTHEQPFMEWKHVFDINVHGVWLSMKHELAVMLAHSSGVIVNVASIAGMGGYPRHSAYSASKHAVVGLTRTAALEYVRRGIRVNAICPGFTDTAMVRDGIAQKIVSEERLLRGIPARRFGRPDEIAAAAVYLCSDAAAFVVGHTLVLDGGIRAS